MNPSLDTTISAIGRLIYHLAKDPESFARLKADPKLATNAAHEAVRIGTPIRSFSRHASRDAQIADVTIPKGARVMMLFAAANRDEAVFENAAHFDITRRNARRHLGFGAGIHMCVGMHLALLEIECLIASLCAKVDRMALTTHRVALNNSISAFSSLEVALYR